MPETVELPLNSVKDWLNKESSSLVGPLRTEAKNILEDVKSKLEELLDGCDKLLDDAEKELAKGSKKTYRRAKFLFKLAGTFSSSIEEVTFPEEINAKALNETAGQLEKTMKIIGQEKTKWFRALSPYFIMSRRRFDVSFKRADDSFQTFNTFMKEKYVKAESAENVFSKVDDLTQALDELNKYKTDKETRKQKKEHLETRMRDGRQKLESIHSKDEVIELSQLNAHVDELTKEVKHELRHLQKPLLKFQTLVTSPGYSLLPDATSKLDDYLTNSFDALATEKQGYPLLKIILQKIDTALDNKKMKLKPSRLRKAKDQIARIVDKSALDLLQTKCADAFTKRAELAGSGVISKSRDERAELQEHLKELQRKKSILETRDTLFEKEHKEARRKFDEQKKGLEKTVSELFNKSVKVVID